MPSRVYLLAGSLDPTGLLPLDALTIANMWETSALVELLERKGLLLRGK